MESVIDDLFILSVSITNNRIEEDFNEVVTKQTNANPNDQNPKNKKSEESLEKEFSKLKSKL